MALAVVHFVEVHPLKSVLLGVQLWQVQFLEIFIFYIYTQLNKKTYNNQEIRTSNNKTSIIQNCKRRLSKLINTINN